VASATGIAPVAGLTNLNANEVNVDSKNLVTVKSNQAQTLTQALISNAQAQRNADALTERLRLGGYLRPGQHVVGFANGKVYTASAEAGR